MMYTRASASDYNDWKMKHENPGWGSEDLVPLLKKVRLCLGATGQPSFFVFPYSVG
jgi:alcohol oxidase